jgi:RNA polymerase sigma-70 factor (ECF subfamily)
MLESDVNNPIDDNDLVRQVLTDANKFRYLVDKYEQPLRRYLLHIFHASSDDAEDILQEVFIAVYRNLNGFDQSLKFSTWIYRIAHNKAIDFWRSRQSDHVVDWDDELVINMPDLSDLVGDLDNDYLKNNLNKIIDRLDHKYKEVIVLRYIEDKNYDEISDILQKPPGTIAAWLNRAKKELRKLAEEQHEKFK